MHQGPFFGPLMIKRSLSPLCWTYANEYINITELYVIWDSNIWTTNPSKIWIIAVPNSVFLCNCCGRHGPILIKNELWQVEVSVVWNPLGFQASIFSHSWCHKKTSRASFVSCLTAWPAVSPFGIQMWRMPSTAEKKHAAHNPRLTHAFPWNSTCPTPSAKHRVRITLLEQHVATRWRSLPNYEQWSISACPSG